MPNWIAITTDTLNEASIAELIEALSEEALAAGQPSRAPGLIQGVVDEVRAAVASCATNRVDEDETTIPKSLRDCTVDLVIARLKKALNQPLTDDEAREVTERRRQLRDVAACSLVVDQPDTPVEPEVESPQPSPQFEDRTRKFTDRSQDG